MNIPPLKKSPLKDIRKVFSNIKSIESDTSPEEGGEIEIVSVLEGNEKYVSGEKLLERTKGAFGFSHAKYLYENQELLKEFDNSLYYVFPTTVFRDADGSRHIAYLVWNFGRWQLDWSWAGHDFFRSCRFLRFRKLATGALDTSDTRILGLLERVQALEEKLEKIAKVLLEKEK